MIMSALSSSSAAASSVCKDFILWTLTEEQGAHILCSCSMCYIASTELLSAAINCINGGLNIIRCFIILFRIHVIIPKLRLDAVRCLSFIYSFEKRNWFMGCMNIFTLEFCNRKSSTLNKYYGSNANRSKDFVWDMSTSLLTINEEKIIQFDKSTKGI